MYHTYIIASLASGKWYYGSTTDLDERLKYHNNGWNRSTKGRGQWKYIFLRPFSAAEEAREMKWSLCAEFPPYPNSAYSDTNCARVRKHLHNFYFISPVIFYFYQTLRHSPLLPMIDRRSFLKLSLLPVAAFPLIHSACTKPDLGLMKTLSQPNTLIQICDSISLNEIGNTYRNIKSGEDNYDVLRKLLLIDSSGNEITNTADSVFIHQSIQSHIDRDFKEGKVIKINGWIVSVTEARQCAIFSMLQ